MSSGLEEKRVGDYDLHAGPESLGVHVFEGVDGHRPFHSPPTAASGR
ncbi:hypothetical protein OG315_20235 [Streptomyces atratus]|nr:hypothetical protein [Streptomyces atratus]